MVLRFYNSLSRTIEEFKPINDTSVGFYSCGPTVYNFPHIGNFRAYIFADILKRVLLFSSFNVHHIMNLTDVDDKTIRDSQKENRTLKEFTEFYAEAFYQDRDLLNILPPEKYTKATDYIEEMVAIIVTLIKKDYAYKSEDGSIYFKISKDTDYGKLSHLVLEELTANASLRMKADEYDKDSVQDFALWKAWDKNDGDVYWDTVLGRGRPGWHIECSAMSMSTLGHHFDIHTGGKDNLFPHHENEIAQSESATGEPFVNYWLHNEWLLVDGKKMAKSAGNFYTLRDIENRNFDPLSFRYLTLLTHYRTPLNFTWEGLLASETALVRLRNHVQSFPEGGEINTIYRKKFEEIMENDVDTPRALALSWEILKDTTVSPESKRATILLFDTIYGLSLDKKTAVYPIPKEVTELLNEREEARKEKKWDRSDILRDTIEKMGYGIIDDATGTKIFRKKNLE